MKKKTANEKLIDAAVAAAKAELAGTSVSNSTFVGVQWDAKAVDAITAIASALGKNAESQLETARGLKALSEVLKASNVEVECMLKIQGR
ncbi:hypothetical protein D3C85_657170 [compost metagenome]